MKQVLLRKHVAEKVVSPDVGPTKDSRLGSVLDPSSMHSVSD
jgi:hypothetical protein